MLFRLLSLGSAMLCLAASNPVRADIVTLVGGRSIEGRLVEATDDQFKLKTFAGPRDVPKDQVAKHDPRSGTAFAQYEAAALTGAEDPVIQLALARTCLKHQGFALARKHLERARALGIEEAKAVALSKEILRMETAWRKGLPQPTGVVLKVGTVQLLEGEERDWLVKGVEAASELLFQITLGGLYIQEVVVEAGSPKGHLVYDKTFTGMPNGMTNIPMGTANWWAPVIVHEMGHAVWGLPDDDNAGNGGKWGESKYPCIMAHQWDQGFGRCCRKILCATYRKERLSIFLERLKEECEESVPVLKVTWKNAPAPKRSEP